MSHASLSAVVLGGGSWGTALAHVLARAGHTVTLLVRDGELDDCINRTHGNSRYLEGLPLCPTIHALADEQFLFPAHSRARSVLAAADLLVIAVPCQAIRNTLKTCASALVSPSCVLVNASKGIEIFNKVTIEHIIREELPLFAERYAVLSGPSFAREAVQEKPTAVVLGCRDEALGASLRDVFATPWFRTYSSTDVTGVELGGAIKNVIAIAAGITDGLGFGLNTRAALVTRGLAEIRRLGVRMGARPETFTGLSGIGDLMLTCSGSLSRNRQTGLRLGAGERLDDILGSTRSVAEGVPTTRAVHELSLAHNVEMPIVNAMFGVLHEHLNPLDAVRNLMSRRLKSED